MSFVIQALEADQFSHLFSMSAADLKGHHALRCKVTDEPGFPCRISLADADIGEEVILLHYTHQPEDTPYRASHAIYVRENVTTAQPAPRDIPETLKMRLSSVRAFTATHLMKIADVVDGADLGDILNSIFTDPDIAYIHIHNAKTGCFLAKAARI